MTHRNTIPMMFIKKSLFALAVFACSFLLWKPVQAQAAEQTVANLVLMVNFAGNNKNDFATGYKGVEAMYTGTSGVHSYISAISDGKVEVKSFFPQDYNDQFFAITLPGEAKDYASARDDSEFIAKVIAEAQKLLDEDRLKTIAGANLDTWKNEKQSIDECIDNVTFLVQAPNSGIFYPHAAGYGGELYLYGKQVRQYNIVPRDNLIMSDNTCLGYPTVSHEFLHSLGAPDLYRTGGNNVSGQPVGLWDVMAEPLPYGANYPLAYTRKDLGWLDIDTITTNGDYVLQPATATSGNRAYILKTTRSDSEFFVVEYRPGSGSGERFNYDSLYVKERYFVQGGLIVYRVNTSLEDHTNVKGSNYIYVYRPGTASDCEAATEESRLNPGTNAVRDAAITPTGSRTKLGSADLDAPCTDDTIFYTGGTNSGIVIDKVSFNDDGTATFHVEFPTLSEDNYWQRQGSSISGLQYASLDGSSDGSQLYLAGIKEVNGNYKMYLYSYDNALENWAELAGADAFGGTTDVLYADGNVYVACPLNTDHSKICVSSYQNGTLTPVYTSTDGAVKAKLLYRDGKVWLFYYGEEKTHLVDITTGNAYPILAVLNYTASSDAFYFQEKWYAAYSNSAGVYNVGDEKGRIACYENGAWKDVYEINSAAQVTQMVSCVGDDKIYIAAVDDATKNLIYLTGDGSQWTEQVVTDIRVTNGVQLVVKEQIPYIFWVEGSELRAKYLKNDTWTDLAGTISNDTMDFDAFCGGKTLYAATSSSNGFNTSVRKMKTIEGTLDPDPVQPGVGSGNVVLTLPAGYSSSAKLYIDGVEFGSTSWQNDESKRLVSIGSIGPLGKTAQTAAAYNYDASGIPRGMYVWSLAYDGDHYTATAIPEFENLFTYHGFSVRYTGNTGLRCTYGIDSTKKSQLISSSGLNGYRITEMGTLIMRPDNHVGNPMIYGSSKVSGGRTYWVANGKVYNKVIRKTGGRDQFANVLTKLPPSRYNTAYYFRAYAVMSHNGSDVVIYGPEMSRSMYTVCKQILNRGDFKPGSSGYRFLKNIVDSVENK